MTAPVLIRAATAADAPVLADLRYEFRAGLDPAVEDRDTFVARCLPWMRSRLTDRSWRCWVAELEHVVVGSVWLLSMEKLPNPVGEGEHYGYVSNLYVRRDLRSGGLGSQLLDRCLEACDAGGYDSVFLWPTARSRSLYLRHGFAAGGEVLERRIAPRPAHGGSP